MSAPPKRRKALVNCEAKARFVDDVQARAAAMASLEKHGSTEGCDTLWVYKCRECKGWHLTKQKGPRFFKVTADQPVH